MRRIAMVLVLVLYVGSGWVGWCVQDGWTGPKRSYRRQAILDCVEHNELYVGHDAVVLEVGE